jgi:hypothetical protein
MAGANILHLLAGECLNLPIMLQILPAGALKLGRIPLKHSRAVATMAVSERLILLFRNDLRVHDNVIVHTAAQAAQARSDVEVCHAMIPDYLGRRWHGALCAGNLLSIAATFRHADGNGLFFLAQPVILNPLETLEIIIHLCRRHLGKI